MTWRSPDDRRAPLHDWGGLRSAYTWSIVCAYGVLAVVAALLLILGGALWWDRDRGRFHRIAAWWGAALSKRATVRPVELRGLEHLAGGPYVITPNHQSVVDLLVLFTLPFPYRLVVKGSWFRSPFGLNLWAAGYVPVHRGQASEIFRRCRQWLERGMSVMMFPEGRRSRTWTVNRFKRGVFELAVDTGTPILPVAVAGTNDVSHPSSIRFSYADLRIIVEVLPPIPVEGRSSETVRGECRTLLTAKVDQLRAELREHNNQGPV